MIAWFYLVVLVSSVIMTAGILLRNRKVDNSFILFCFLMNINCAGRYLFAVAKTAEQAVMGNKIMYIGACYLPFVILGVVTRLCNIKVNHWLKVGLLGYATLVLGFVMTIGHSSLYYKSVELVRKNGYSYLVKEYGPFHVLYPIMVGLYIVMMLCFIGYAIRKRKEIPTQTVVCMGGLCLAVFLTYFLERVLDSKVSYVPIGYLIGMVFLMRYFGRINMYDMSANILSSIEKMQEYGYIVIDNKCRYISANENVKKLFPEVMDWTVDKAVPVTDGCLYQKVIRGLQRDDDDILTNRMLSVGERYFQVDVRELTHGKKSLVGFLIEFVDRTTERKYINAIHDYNAKLEQEVDEKTEHITYIKDMMVLGMAEMVESRDANTGGHIKRTSQVVRIFAEKLMACKERFGVSGDFLKLVIKAAPMHDLGKIAIPDAVLRKPGKYTDEEYAQMKRHSAEGEQIVTEILQGVEDEAFVNVAKNVALYHHEKWNGGGYPTGKAGTDIPMEARIMALADVFDALVSKRCYKDAFSYDEAFRIMEESLGQHFDPELGKVFMECREELEAFYDAN